MKYIKYSVIILFLCIGFKLFVSDALFVYINGVDLPSFRGRYATMSREKMTNDEQYAWKIEATDNLSGDDRNIQGKLYGQTAGAGVTDYYELPTGINVYFGNSSKTLGSYQLWLMATKSTLTTVKYYGGWEV